MKRKSGDASRAESDAPSVPRFTRAEMRRATLGKYAPGAADRARLAELDRDVARAFPDDRAINDALRLVIKLRQIGFGARKRPA